MANFIIVDSILVSYNNYSEDQTLMDLTAREIGDCRLLLPINSILSITEIPDDSTTTIKLINQEQIFCKNTFNEIIEKINAAQFITLLQ
jgi:uncharacterized protein YlzI (FlbEa/FlbD family)